MNDVPNLRSSRRFAVIRRSFAAAKGLHGLRLVELTVMGNHLHLMDWFSSENPELRELLEAPMTWLLSFGWRRARAMKRPAAPEDGRPESSTTKT
jgi:hypothetical protein